MKEMLVFVDGASVSSPFGGPKTPELDKVGKYTHRVKQEDPSFGTYPYPQRGR